MSSVPPQRKVIFILLGTTGDIYPLIPLARVLSHSPLVEHCTVAAPVTELRGLPETTDQLSFVGLHSAEGSAKRARGSAERDSTSNSSLFDECLLVSMGHHCVIFNLFALVGWMYALLLARWWLTVVVVEGGGVPGCVLHRGQPLSNPILDTHRL